MIAVLKHTKVIRLVFTLLLLSCFLNVGHFWILHAKEKINIKSKVSKDLNYVAESQLDEVACLFCEYEVNKAFTIKELKQRGVVWFIREGNQNLQTKVKCNASSRYYYTRGPPKSNKI
ncbi:hypothetical protein V2574_06225 [Tenacibaculum maritimum]